MRRRLLPHGLRLLMPLLHLLRLLRVALLHLLDLAGVGLLLRHALMLLRLLLRHALMFFVLRLYLLLALLRLTLLLGVGVVGRRRSGVRRYVARMHRSSLVVLRLVLRTSNGVGAVRLVFRTRCSFRSCRRPRIVRRGISLRRMIRGSRLPRRHYSGAVERRRPGRCRYRRLAVIGGGAELGISAGLLHVLLLCRED